LTAVALLLGTTFYNQFDFETIEFDDTTLAILYSIVLLLSICGKAKNDKKQSKK
jgi:hypothetical protein